MPSPFDAFDAALQSAVGAAFGESIQVTPRAASQYGATQTDTARTMQSVRGVFSLAPATEEISGQRVGPQLPGFTQFAHSSAEVWISASDYLAIGYAIVKGDLIVLPGMATQSRYAVSRVSQTDQGEVSLILVAEKQ